MTRHEPPDEQTDLQVAIDPEPSPEEFVAIMVALRKMLEPKGRETSNVHPKTLQWTRVARREMLRSAGWPPQRNTWESGFR